MTSLASGHHLYPGPDGTWTCAAPGDRFTRLGGPAHVVERVWRVLTEQSRSAHDEHDSDPECIDQLLAVLAERSFVTEADDTVDTHQKSVIVDGDNPVASAVTDLLRGRVHIVEGSVDEDSVATADLLISCSGWLPDARWRAMERWCIDHGTAWQRCHFEGDAVFVGPLWDTTPTSANYSDVRARRLAAATLPDELRALWRYLDEPARATPMRWPERAETAFVASAIVLDVTRYLTGGPVDPAQFELHPESLVIERHPVVAIPHRNASRAHA